MQPVDAMDEEKPALEPGHVSARTLRGGPAHWPLLVGGSVGALLAGVAIGMAVAGLRDRGFRAVPADLSESEKQTNFGLWLTNAECMPASGDEGAPAADLGEQRSLRECAVACAAQAGCDYFSFGRSLSGLEVSGGYPCRREPAKGCAQRMHSKHSDRDVFVLRSGLRFNASRASEVFGELSAAEVRAVSKWFMAKTGAEPNRANIRTKMWLSGSAAVELIRPPKAAVLAYLDGKGSKPERSARVTVVGEGYVAEYKVGPLEKGKPSAAAKISTLVPKGSIPYTKRPTELNSEELLVADHIKASLRDIGVPLLLDFFGPIFKSLADEGGFKSDGSAGSASMILRNDALSPKGVRRSRVKWFWHPPAPTRPDTMWLHTLPLVWEMDMTSQNVTQWTSTHFVLCNQGPFKSGAELRRAVSEGKVRKCKTDLNKTDGWDVPQHKDPGMPFAKGETHGGVTWGPWSFAVTQRMSTGLALFDVRFRGQRILYELSLQDAQAAYAGDLRAQFFYSDSSWSLSMISKSLKPGVDCPAHAHYLSAANWWPLDDTHRPDPSKARDFWPICVFEWAEDHTIWRHMDQSEVRGLVRRTVVVRSIATVGNYDYITDVKMREDGEINVETRFAGYIESRHFDAAVDPGEQHFSSIVRPDLAGIVHAHLVAYKADFDIAGTTANSLRVTQVKPHPSEGLDVSWKGDEQEPRFWSKVLEHRYIEKEGQGESTFVTNPRTPSVWTIVDRHSSASPNTSPRGYAVQLATASPVQVLPDDHPFVMAMPYTKHHLAVTRYHDSEYRVNSGYVHYDGQVRWVGEGAQDLDLYLDDKETLVDEDLVAWICVGKEHVVRSEDLPLVSNFGGGFSLVPWNFFPGNVASNPPA